MFGKMRQLSLTFLVLLTLSMPSWASAMQIFVKKVDGQTIPIEIEANDTVNAVMLKIEENESYPSSIQRLFFAGKQLDAERTIADYNIQKESTLHLILRERVSILMLWGRAEGFTP
jgi:hypothetical protein